MLMMLMMLYIKQSPRTNGHDVTIEHVSAMPRRVNDIRLMPPRRREREQRAR